MLPTSSMAGYFPKRNYWRGRQCPSSLELVQRYKHKLAANQNDALRRMAIRNSYETRSLGGTCGLRCTTTPSTAHLLPPIIIQSTNVQRGRRRGERSLSPTSLHYVDGRPRSSSDQLHVTGVSRDTSGSLKRSSSQSNVAVHKTAPTIQAENSSYVYHTPSGRKIGNAGRRKAYENVRLLAPPQTQSDMKRSSSCSTVTANSTSLKPKEDKAVTSASNLPSSYSLQGTSWSYNSTCRPAAVHPQHTQRSLQHSESTKLTAAWSQEPQHPRVLKHVVHTNGTSGKLLPLHSTEQYHPHTHFPLNFTNYRTNLPSGPSSLPPHYDTRLPTSRFERTPATFPVNGLTPPLVYPRSPSAAHAKIKRIQLHTPRGRKVASLV